MYIEVSLILIEERVIVLVIVFDNILTASGFQEFDMAIDLLLLVSLQTRLAHLSAVSDQGMLETKHSQDDRLPVLTVESIFSFLNETLFMGIEESFLAGLAI